MQETSEMGAKIPAGRTEVGLLESALPWPYSLQECTAPGDFPGSPGVRLCNHCAGGPGLDPWLRTKILHASQ